MKTEDKPFFGVLVVLAFLLAPIAVDLHQRNEQSANQNSDPQIHQNEIAKKAAARTVQTPATFARNDNGRSSQEQQDGDTSEEIKWFGDTPAQWAMALFSLLALIFSAVAIAVLVETLKTTSKIGKAQVRAFLTGEKATFTVDHEKLAFMPVIKNSGQSPALNVLIRAYLHWPIKNEDGKIIGGAKSRIVHGSCPAIPAGQEDNGLIIVSHEVISGPELDRIYHGAELTVRCHVVWNDVFGDTQYADIVFREKLADEEGRAYDEDVTRVGEMTAFNSYIAERPKEQRDHPF